MGVLHRSQRVTGFEALPHEGLLLRGAFWEDVELRLLVVKLPRIHSGSNASDNRSLLDPLACAGEDELVPSHMVPTQAIRDLMKRPRACSIKEKSPALSNLGMPAKMLRFYPLKREMLNPSSISVVSMHDHRNSSEILHFFSSQLQNSPKFLLKRRPIALGRRQKSVPVHKDTELPVILIALAHDPSHSDLGGIGSSFIRPSSGRLSCHPSRGGFHCSFFIRNCQPMRLNHQLLDLFNSSQLQLIRWELRPRLQ